MPRARPHPNTEPPVDIAPAFPEPEPAFPSTFPPIEPTPAPVASIITAPPEPTPQVPLTIDPGELLKALISLMRTAKDRRARPVAGWHIIVVPDTAPSRIEHFESIENMVNRLRELRAVGQQQVWPFAGTPFGISKGGDYLVAGQFGRFPLFTAVENDELDPQGFLGAQPVFTPQPPEPERTDSGVGYDDEDEDNDPEDDDR